MYGSNLLVIPAIFFSPESPSWLIKKGRKKEAYDILRKVAETRGIELEEDDFFLRIADTVAKEEEGEGQEMSKHVQRGSDAANRRDGPLKQEEEKEEEVKMLRRRSVGLDENDNEESHPHENEKKLVDSSGNDAFKRETLSSKSIVSTHQDNGIGSTIFSRAVRSKYVMALLLIAGVYWSFFNFIYIGITFSYASLPGSRYVNFALIQLTGIPARFLGIAVCAMVNRRPTLAIGTGITGAGIRRANKRE